MTSRGSEGRTKRLVRSLVPALLLDVARAARLRRSVPHGAALPTDPMVEFRIPPRTLEEAFPGISSVRVVLDAAELDRGDEWLMPLPELLTIAAICQHVRPTRVLEFGTYLGSATAAISDNTPPHAEIFTLDLDPAARATHRHGLGVGGFPEFEVGARFRGRPAAAKIRQLYGDSLTFDFARFAGSVDLVLIDGDHTYEFVKADTANAFAVLRPGGVIVWDDYRWSPRHPECAGVTRAVNELLPGRDCFALAGTRLAAVRSG